MGLGKLNRISPSENAQRHALLLRRGVFICLALDTYSLMCNNQSMKPFKAYIVASKKGNWHVPCTFHIYKSVTKELAERHFTDTWKNLKKEGYRIRKIKIKEIVK